MQQTTNYNLNKFDSTDELESATRLGLNENADTIDTALKGIQDDIDGLTAAEVSYDNTDSGLTATDVQGAIDELVVYSTTETVVGTWIDGKPIYRKCFTITTPSTQDTPTNIVKVTDLHIENLIYDYFSIAIPGNITTSSNNPNAFLYMRRNFDPNDYLTMAVLNAAYLGKSGLIIIEYTKTTD